MSRTLIIIPTFNEHENIGRLVDRLCELYPAINILVVDDSPDQRTADAVRGSEHFGKNLNLLRREGGKGRGSAVLDGFAYALERDFDLIFEMDADFSHKPEEVQLFLDTISHYDCIVGSRYLPGSEIHHWGFKRTFFSKWANRYARLILGIPLSDYTNGFRCYARKAIESLDRNEIEAKGYVVLSAIAYQLHRSGMRLGEVPTIFVNRRRGESNLSIHEIKEAFFSVLQIRSKRLYLHAKQIIKFVFCGATAAFIDLFSLAFFVEVMDMHPQIAFFPSTVFAVAYVFLFNKYITFRSHNHHILHQLWKFFVVYIGAIILNLAIASFLLWMGVFYLLSKAIAIGIGAVINYILSHKFVFRAH